ncbi:MAG: hypothetical protein PHC61_13900, partial [Chitinivibrionales bacterium]|nr:hypothetical protein [Chitinivibrionales bacterium]
ATIVSSMSALVGFYPNHIMKEDKVFFPDSMAYFSREEDQAMLAEFWGFDRKLIHEKYIAVVQKLEEISVEGNKRQWRKI